MSGHRVAIMWGRELSRENAPKVYEFETLAERNAFLHGVEAAVGWQEYHIVQMEQRKYDR